MNKQQDVNYRSNYDKPEVLLRM